MTKINVIGLGFVGLTTAIGFSYKNHKVNVIEKDSSKLNKIKKGILPFHEPFLREKLKQAIKNKKISFPNKINLNKNEINIFFICIGTPSKANGSTDFNQILNFLTDIKKIMNNEKILFVIKSTVPPFSIEKTFKKIFKQKKNIYFCSNPEFLREGHAWEDFFNSGKIVIGYDDLFVKKIMIKIYKNFKDKKILVNTVTAEFIKYLSNSMLASMISFSNDMAILAEKMKKIDIKKSFDAIKKDKRWYGKPSEMKNYFHPGLGYGGYCLPKDIKSLKNISKKYSNHGLLEKIDNINEKIFKFQLNKVSKINPKKKLFILGLSFKPGSDDLRSSKSIELVKRLLKLKRKIIASDPISSKIAKKIFKDKIKIYEKPFVAKNTIYVLTTAWPQYIRFLSKINRNNIIDLRYVL